MVQKKQPGQMFKCAVKSMVVKKEGVAINLVQAPKGVLDTLVDFVGCEVMVVFESPQGSFDFSEDKTTK